MLGIFTDEPHRGALLNGFGTMNKNNVNMLPYSYSLFEKYRAVSGMDLAAKLPELYYKRADSKVNRTMYYYIETIDRKSVV